jgi:hypothetical protein
VGRDPPVLRLRLRYQHKGEPTPEDIAGVIADLETAYRHCYLWAAGERNRPPILARVPEPHFATTLKVWPSPKVPPLGPDVSFSVRRFVLRSPLEVVLTIPHEYWASASLALVLFVKNIESLFTAPARIALTYKSARVEMERADVELIELGAARYRAMADRERAREEYRLQRSPFHLEEGELSRERRPRKG